MLSETVTKTELPNEMFSSQYSMEGVRGERRNCNALQAGGDSVWQL